MKLLFVSVGILFLTACAGSREQPQARWSGYGPLPLQNSSPLIPIPTANAAMPIITDEQLQVRKIPDVKAPLPVPQFD